MFDFILQGGVLGMSTVLLSGGGAILWSIFASAKIIKKGSLSKRHLDAILFLGSLSFFLGILWQGIGLTEAMDTIQHFENISPQAIAGGLKVSMISSITGAILFVISAAFWFILRYQNSKIKKVA